MAGGSDLSVLESIGKIGLSVAAPELAVPIALEGAAESTINGGSPIMGLASAAMGGMDGGALGEVGGGLSDVGAQTFMDSGVLPGQVAQGVAPMVDTGMALQAPGTGASLNGGSGLMDTGAPVSTSAAAPVTSDANPLAVQTPSTPDYSTGSDASITRQYANNGTNALNPAGSMATSKADVLSNSSEPSTLDSLKEAWKNPWIKGGILGAGALGAYGMMSQDNKRFTTPTNQPYSGPLSQFSYNPNTYTPVTVAQPTPYRAHYAEGGAVDNTVEQMSNQNSIGANQSYPQAGIMSNAYATPTNVPIASNVLADPSESNVDPYTGEQKFYRGGITAAKTNDMQAIDEYASQASQEGGLAQVMAKAKAGDYNAMIALNKLNNTPNQNYARGGGVGSKEGHLGSYSDGGRMLKGPGDGMSDDIPASISGKQPARLADSEFVVPADVVSHLGNGSSDAGAKKLYSMMDNVRKARTGTKKQGKQINADKYLPK